jgi:hypothetical protein
MSKGNNGLHRLYDKLEPEMADECGESMLGLWRKYMDRAA